MAKQGQYLELERCPHCSVDRPSLGRQTFFETSDHSRTINRNWVMYVCKRCGGVITAWSHKGSADIQEMYPAPIEVDEEIPDRAKAYLAQAISSISAPAGAVMLAASSVDAMLKEKGFSEGSLSARIDRAAKEHLITEEMSQWAHAVRLDANEQRHSDNDSALPTSENAQKLIDFVQALGMVLFVLPAQVKRGRTKAQGSKQIN